MCRDLAELLRGGETGYKKMDRVVGTLCSNEVEYSRMKEQDLGWIEAQRSVYIGVLL